jgi:hypothetical protein
MAKAAFLFHGISPIINDGVRVEAVFLFCGETPIINDGVRGRMNWEKGI